jgi:DNA-directed RNA polymerase subunit RPC12/RpoP
MPETATYSYLARRPRVDAPLMLMCIEEASISISPLPLCSKRSTVAETIRDNSEARELSVTMQIKCPRCQTKMLLQVGLTLNAPTNNSVGCINCKNKLIPLVPGPIIGGPFLWLHAWS